MTFPPVAILDVLDRAAADFTFPMLDNGYVYLAASPLSLHRSASDWAVMFERFGFFTGLMDEGGAMLWGRVTYEMMESYWPAVARGDVEAPPALRVWAEKLEAKPKYVVSSTRTDFPWTNSHHLAGDLRAGVQQLKDATPAGVLLGSRDRAGPDGADRRVQVPRPPPGSLATAPMLYQGGLPSTRRLELVSAKPFRCGAVALHYRRAR